MDFNISTENRKVFALYQFAVMFLLPTIIMVFCYSIVILVLWVSTKELAKMTQGQTDQ
jgi:hypothetical protein